MVKYVKIYAPFDWLCQEAQEMRVKMPTKENDIDIRPWYQKTSWYAHLADCNPFKVKNSTFEKEKDYFVADFCKEKLQKYSNHDNRDRFFTSSERS